MEQRTIRRQFVLFGSSIVQYSFHDGWGANLAHIYARKADIILRGYAGWNSRRALKVVDTIFPKFAPKQPDLVIVYFGGNDSTLKHESGYGPHVPLVEYKENMRMIARHLKDLSEETRIIFLTPPPVDEEKIKIHERKIKIHGKKKKTGPPVDDGKKEEIGPLVNDEQIKNSSGESEKPTKTNEECGKYANACLEMCTKEDIKVIDLWDLFQKNKDWKSDYIRNDGVHLTPKGNKVVSDEILKVLKEVDWKPSLHYEEMPAEFGDDSPYDPISPHVLTMNISHAPFPSPWEDIAPNSRM